MSNFISRRLSKMARDRGLDLMDISLLHDFVDGKTPVNLRHTLDVFEHMHKGKRTRILGKPAELIELKRKH